MNKNIIIVGAGPGLSLSIAEKFGSEGFSVGLISRNEVKTSQLAKDLKEKGVNSFYAIADAYNTGELEEAINHLVDKMGSIDVISYNAAAMKHKNILDETTDELVDDFRVSVANAFHSVNILHSQLKQNRGAVLLTGGGFGIYPAPEFGSLSIGKAALRNLALQLHDSLKSDGIYVGILTILGLINPDSDKYSPKVLAEKFWDLYSSKSQAELQV